MGRYCLDASFVLAWPLGGRGSRNAKELLCGDQVDAELIGPYLLLAEVSSSLREGVYRGVISREAAHEALDEVLELPIDWVNSPVIYRRATDFSERLGWAKAYDALYLAVADLERAELLTIDSGMRDAALRLGIRAQLIGA